MIGAPKTPSEDRRLETLRAYNILDTLPEEEFDDLTALAAAICQTPIALVSLVDANRQWFKSRVGLEATETSREAAFCAHTILGSETMIVRDAHLDDRFHDNPLVLGDPLIRFYAGAPLVVPNGECLGTLCVVDRIPRDLTPMQVQALATLARHVASRLESRRRIAELERGNRPATAQQFADDERFRILSDAAPVGIFETDAHGACLYTNASWQRITGMTFGESLGDGWSRAVHPDDVEAVGTEWQRAVEEKREFAMEFRFRTAAGMVSHVESRARSIVTPAGDICGYVGTVKDVTQRREAQDALRASREQLQRVIEGSSDGFWDWNVATGHVEFSARLAEMLGYALDEFPPHVETWERLIHPDDVAEVRSVLADHLQGRTPYYENEHRLLTRSGEWRWILDRGRVYERAADGSPLRMAGTHADIHSRKMAEENLARFFSVSLDLLCIAGMDGRFRRLNPSFETILGYTEKELLTRPFLDFVHPDDRASTALEMQRLAAGLVTFRFENRYLCRDGSVKWIAWTATPYIEQGLIYAAGRDITEARKSEAEVRASEAALRSIILGSLSGIVTFDTAGNIESVNPAAEAILGYSYAQLAGENVSVFLPNPPPDLASFQRQAVRDSLGKVTEWQVRHADGRLIDIELSLFEFQTADGPRVACNLHDVSQRREVDRMKREFLATVSHELRTPLTSIRGSLDLLGAGVLGALGPQAQEVVSIAHRNTTRLIGLINDLLDLDRLDVGKLEIHPETVEVDHLVLTAVESVRAFAEQSGVAVEVSRLAATVVADSDRMVQVLVNLLSNAVKFSNRGSAIQIDALRQGPDVAIRVRDRGRGIPQTHLATIFDRFQQVEASDARSKGGSGLGLAICRAIMELHGGTIEVESEEGKGSTFTVRLRAADAPRDRGSLTIGVFTSAPEPRENLVATLLGEGLRVHLLRTPDDVEKAFTQGSISILVMELTKGAPRGEILSRLRSAGVRGETPIIVLTHHTDSIEWFDDNMTVFLSNAAGQSLIDAIRKFAAESPAGDVLIVEDDPALLEILKLQLEMEGMAVRTADAGGAAVAMIRKAPPRLIVLDVGLPDIDGFDVVSMLRRDPRLRRLPLLVYSGRDLENEDKRRLELGPTRFLRKASSGEDEFRSVVAELIRSTMMERVP